MIRVLEAVCLVVVIVVAGVMVDVVTQAQAQTHGSVSSGHHISGRVASTALPHIVTLTWVASVAPGVVSHNVYRSTTSGGPYSQIGSVSGYGTSFVDKSVVAGQTYYYTVTAVAPVDFLFDGRPSGAPVEGGFSNEAAATVPSP